MVRDKTIEIGIWWFISASIVIYFSPSKMKLIEVIFMLPFFLHPNSCRKLGNFLFIHNFFQFCSNCFYAGHFSTAMTKLSDISSSATSWVFVSEANAGTNFRCFFRRVEFLNTGPNFKLWSISDLVWAQTGGVLWPISWM